MIKYRYQGRGFDEQLARKGLGPQGKPYPPGFLLALYRSMLRIRLIELEIARRYHEDEMKTPIHLVVGQEATAVGMCAALGREDLLYATHRTHGAYLAKGGDLNAMMSELYCRANGCAGSRGGSMHLIDKAVGMDSTSAIVGGIVPIAAGVALSIQLRKEDRVAVAFFGDGATEEGVVSETLNFAALKKLPLIFFCENNFFSVCSPLDKRQPGVEIHKRAAGFGVAATVVDGCNVLEVFEATKAAVERAKQGGGPTFIEAPVYRWLAHAGAEDDSPTGYRDVAEPQAWQKQACPVDLYGTYLRALGVLDDRRVQAMEAEIKDEIQRSFAHAIASPAPTEKDLLRNVYALG